MNRYLKYSKITQVYIPEDPRSTHLSDSNQSQESKEVNGTKDLATHDSSQQQKQEEEEGGGREMFGLVLSRSTSVSSHGVKVEKQQNAGVDVAVTRAFSMRRSSSVSEGYCKIHHQTEPTAAADPDMPTTRIKKKRSINLFKGCKLLFGL